MSSKVIMNFTDFGNREWKDKIHGGKGDDYTPDDFDEDDIKIGTAVEREHSNNPDIATELTIDHLAEDPDYYDKLIMAGLADEEDAVNLFNDLKSDGDKKKAKSDIMDNFEDEEGGDDYSSEDYSDDEDDIEEDDLGTDKADIEDDDELIMDDENPEEKINKNTMEKKSIKDFKSFVNETATTPEETGPVRKFKGEKGGKQIEVDKENKYKFEIKYTKELEKSLQDRSFSPMSPDGEALNNKAFIIIDIANLSYMVTDKSNPGIKDIDARGLKKIFEGL
jgi:hypothetical protein